MADSTKAASLPVLAHVHLAEEGAAELRALYARYASTITHRIATLTGDFVGAPDLTQETFVIAWRSRARCEPGSSRKAWIFGIALNVARNARRKLRRRDDARQRAESKQAPLAANPEEQLIGERAAAALLEVFRTLSPERQDAFGLRVLEGLPLSECAEILKVPETTISHRARQAERVLREALDRTGSER